MEIFVGEETGSLRHGCVSPWLDGDVGGRGRLGPEVVDEGKKGLLGV